MPVNVNELETRDRWDLANNLLFLLMDRLENWWLHVIKDTRRLYLSLSCDQLSDIPP